MTREELRGFHVPAIKPTTENTEKIPVKHR